MQAATGKPPSRRLAFGLRGAAAGIAPGFGWRLGECDDAGGAEMARFSATVAPEEAWDARHVR